jgi:hypothetical protein
MKKPTRRGGLKVLLDHQPNWDITSGYRGYWAPTDPCCPTWKPVASLRAASKACMDFIQQHELGGGNWAGGAVMRGDQLLARIAYNGRAWAPGMWPTPEIPLDTKL